MYCECDKKCNVEVRYTRKVLIVIDMQYDFIDGALANKDAEAIVAPICELIKNGDWTDIILTRDTHYLDYSLTAEGKKLPVLHCIEGTKGWLVHENIVKAVMDDTGRTPVYIDKPTFGYKGWNNWSLEDADITVVGTCTDICVVSNVLILKAMFPEANIKVYGNLCAGLTKEKHEAALEIMRSCQVDVEELNLDKAE